MHKLNLNRLTLFILIATGLGLSITFRPVTVVRGDSIVSTNDEIHQVHTGQAGARLPDLVRDRDPFIRIVELTQNSLILELETPLPVVTQTASDVGPCQVLNIEGFAATTEPGWPQLPIKGSFVGIPVQSDPSLSVLEVEATLLPEKYHLCPVGEPVGRMDLDGRIHYEGYRLVEDPQAYAIDRLVTEPRAGLVSTGFIRSQRVAQLSFQPFQYNPVTGEVNYYSRLRVRLDFNPQPGWNEASGNFIEEVGFEAILEANILNYNQARAWRALPIKPSNQVDEVTDDNKIQYKLLVEEAGLYQVTYADLLAAGVLPETLDTLDPHTFRISHQGTEVAIQVVGESDGVFHSDDVILFFAPGLNTVYTNQDVYWLIWGDANGLRMSETDGSPSGSAAVPDQFNSSVQLEDDKIYLSAMPSGSDQDRWYWDYLYATTSPASKQFTTSILPAASSPVDTTVRGLLKGYQATPFHHTQVLLNGHLIDDATWGAEAIYSFEVDVPHSYLLEGINTLSVVCPADMGITLDILYINQFEIDYAAAFTTSDDTLIFSQEAIGDWEFQVTGFTNDLLEVFDITNSDAPIHITGATATQNGSTYTLAFEQSLTAAHQYLALATSQRLSPVGIVLDTPSDLVAASNSADYIVISHADFIAEAQRLADHRAAQGLRSVVVDVQDIYDEFSAGVFDPQAIHEFLDYAYASWTPPAPVFVVLFGDGNYDFKDNQGVGEPNYIPPYLADVDPWIGETAADNRYVDVSGGDILPDLHLGRLTVKTLAGASQVVDKIINYDSNPTNEDWNQRVLFIADNADAAGNFAVASDEIANDFLPSPYTPSKVYLGVTHTTAASARSAILAAMNEGRLLVNYIGHGAYQWWADEQLLHLNNLSALTNHDYLPFIVPMTCMDGHFIFPSPPTLNLSSLGESIVASTSNGAIASWSPTGFGVASGHDFLNKGLFEALFTEDIIQLGAATTQAKMYLAANSTLHNDLLDTYILFGDPATRLNVPTADLRINKTVKPTGALDTGDLITYTLAYTNTGIATAHHVVLSDDLPSMLLDPVIRSSGIEITQRPDTSFVWDAADIAAGESGIITITATVDPEYYGSISNAASIATSARESDSANNVTPSVITLVQRPTSTLLQFFLAMARPGRIELVWETNSEDTLLGFNLYRAGSPSGDVVKINPSLIEVVGGVEGNAYLFVDNNVIAGETYYYWLELTTTNNPYINGPVSATALYLLHLPMLQH